MTNNEIDRLAQQTAVYMMALLKTDNTLADIIFPPRLMSVEELSAQTGVPVGTIYRLKIPSVKFGRRRVFSDRDVARYMAENKQQGDGSQ